MPKNKKQFYKSIFMIVFLVLRTQCGDDSGESIFASLFLCCDSHVPDQEIADSGVPASYACLNLVPDLYVSKFDSYKPSAIKHEDPFAQGKISESVLLAISPSSCSNSPMTEQEIAYAQSQDVYLRAMIAEVKRLLTSGMPEQQIALCKKVYVPTGEELTLFQHIQLLLALGVDPNGSDKNGIAYLAGLGPIFTNLFFEYHANPFVNESQPIKMASDEVVYKLLFQRMSRLAAYDSTLYGPLLIRYLDHIRAEKLPKNQQEN